MATAELVVDSSAPSPQTPGKAKTYNCIKLTTGIASAVLSFVVLLALVAEGITGALSAWSHSLTGNSYIALLVFVFVLGGIQTAVTLPLSYFSGFYIEHRYHLSNQTIGRWGWEKLKGVLVGLPLITIVLVLLYYCLETYGAMWWLPVGIGLTVFSVLLARIAPVIILPLFYKLTPLEDSTLKKRILQLCTDARVAVEGIFSFNLSKNTKKANAAFTGIGKSRRIILGDTLIREFTEEEIGTVFAHELGHYKHRHILIGMCTGTVSTFAGLYIAAQLYEMSLALFGFSHITDLAALPLLALWLSLFSLVTSPIGNMLSRHHERQADRYAVRATGNRSAFISALRKLTAMNLADPDPHPLVEFFLYSHPAIAKRIKLVETVGV